MNKNTEKVIWYINESIINFTLYKNNLSNYTKYNIEYIKSKDSSLDNNIIEEIKKNWIKWNKNINDTYIKTIADIALLCSLRDQTAIFNFTLIKSLIISYFSIFEHYLNIKSYQKIHFLLKNLIFQ